MHFYDICSNSFGPVTFFLFPGSPNAVLESDMTIVDYEYLQLYLLGEMNYLPMHLLVTFVDIS